jgi:hypothetical protein
MTSVREHLPRTTTLVRRGAARDRIGGAAALYLAGALLAAMPYFLLVVDYPSATTAGDKVNLVVDNYPSMYAVYIATYVLFGMAVGLLGLALYDRLAAVAPAIMRAATAVALLWSFVLVASGMVFTYGMTTIVDLHQTDPAQAQQTWQAIEPVAMAMGGAGGELLGGMWLLILSLAAFRGHALARTVCWLGLIIGVLGIISIVPPLQPAAIAFGLLQIVWFLCIAWILLRTSQSERAS